MILRAMALTAGLALSLTACQAEAPAAASPTTARAQSGLEVISLKIRAGAKTHDFSVEVARSEEEQARGLMFREAVGADQGMLFPFTPPRPASFWMKNTLVPLDMIFIRADGSIARVAANTVPYSLEPVGVDEPVAAVLEIAGGRAAELGIDEESRVGWTGGPSL